MKLRITFLAGINDYENIAEYVTGKIYLFIRFSDGRTISIPREDITLVERVYEDRVKPIHLKQFTKKEKDFYNGQT